MCLCMLLLEISAISGYPYPYNADGFRPRRSPHRAVMVSGYYGRPIRRSQYEPEGAMTAFVSGETVATNSYLGGRYPSQESEELEEPLEENVRKGVQQVRPEHIPQQETAEGLGEEEVALSKPTRIPKRKPQKPQQEEEEDEEDQGSWPFQSGRKGPSYNAFFPIMLGGYQGGKGRSDGYPGSATAIANSFSTGKGGVASSHATAYGDPYVSTLLRNGFNFKKKPAQKDEGY